MLLSDLQKGPFASRLVRPQTGLNTRERHNLIQFSETPHKPRCNIFTDIYRVRIKKLFQIQEHDSGTFLYNNCLLKGVSSSFPLQVESCAQCCQRISHKARSEASPFSPLSPRSGPNRVHSSSVDMVQSRAWAGTRGGWPRSSSAAACTWARAGWGAR